MSYYSIASYNCLPPLPTYIHNTVFSQRAFLLPCQCASVISHCTPLFMSHQKYITVYRLLLISLLQSFWQNVQRLVNELHCQLWQEFQTLTTSLTQAVHNTHTSSRVTTVTTAMLQNHELLLISKNNNLEPRSHLRERIW